MSETTRQNLGYPRTELKDVSNFRILKFCGGAGGGACVVLLGATQFVWPVRVPKFLTYNRSLILENPEFIGVDIFTDGGVSGFCDHSAVTRVPWWVGFSDTGVLTDQQVRDQGIQINSAPPHEIEVQGLKLPQPVLLGGGANPNWSGRIYIHIVWDSPLYVQAVNMYDGILRMIKHDYDIKV